MFRFFDRNDEESAPRITESDLIGLEEQVDTILRYLKVSPASAEDGTGVLSSEVADLVARGQKIQAIKLYREETGVGLKEAKDAIDSGEVHLSGGAVGRIGRKLDRVLNELRSGASQEDRPDSGPSPMIDATSPSTTQQTAEKLLDLLRRNQVIDAIKLYRETYNVGLKEAKDAVDELQAKLRR